MHVNVDVSIAPGELVALPLGLGEHDDLLVPNLLKQPGKLRLLLVLVAHVHDLGRQENLQVKFKMVLFGRKRKIRNRCDRFLL